MQDKKHLNVWQKFDYNALQDIKLKKEECFAHVPSIFTVSFEIRMRQFSEILFVTLGEWVVLISEVQL